MLLPVHAGGSTYSQDQMDTELVDSGFGRLDFDRASRLRV